jgi:hypothetical protein
MKEKYEKYIWWWRNMTLEQAQELLEKRAAYQCALRVIEIGMESLSDYERELLDSLERKIPYWYITAGEKYHREKTAVYKDREIALRKFAERLSEI